jgi:hypothetical protein
MQNPDGFRVRRIDDDEEVHFVACSEDGPPRQRAFAALVRTVDFDQYYVEDTRDDEPATGG